MKSIFKYLIGIVIGMIVGVLIACGVYFLTVGNIDWQEYIKSELIPNAVTILTAIGTILVAAIPVINRITAAASRFNSATDDVSKTIYNNGKNEKRIAELEEQLKKITEISKNTEEILRIAFCNLDELVKKGYATEIAKVGQSESEEIET